MEPASRALVHLPVAVFLASLDRNVKQRLMHVTPTLATMARLATASLLAMPALVLLDSRVLTAPQGLTIVTTLHAIMVALVPMA